MINDDEHGGEADEWREVSANHITSTKTAFLLPQQTLKQRQTTFALEARGVLAQTGAENHQ